MTFTKKQKEGGGGEGAIKITMRITTRINGKLVSFDRKLPFTTKEVEKFKSGEKYI